jgi:hypothetical protein
VPLKGSRIHLDLPSDSGPADTSGIYVLPHGSSYTVTTHSLHSGTFGMLLLSQGIGGGITSTRSTAGQSDSLTLSPGSPSFAFSSTASAPVTLELVGGKAGVGEQTAILSLSSARGTTVASLSHAGQLTVHHSGASAALTLQLFSHGVAAGTSTIPLHSGSTVSLRPNWSHLGDSVSATLGGVHRTLSLSAARAGALSKRLHLTHGRPKHKAKRRRKS